jgi:hypothetical protein
MSKIYKVKWTSNAKEDLLNIVDYIKKDSLSAARKVYPKLCIRNSQISTNHLPIGTSLNFLNYQTGSPAKFIKIPIAKH